MSALVAYHGQPFEHVFITSAIAMPDDPKRPDIDVDFEMTLRDQKGQVAYELINGVGLAPAVNNDDTAVIVMSINEPSYIEANDYHYEISARDGSGRTVLSESGSLRILKSIPEMNRLEHTVKPWDMFNPSVPRVTREEKDARLAVCTVCPRFLAGFCRECGCRMKWKATLSDATCPLGKW